MKEQRIEITDELLEQISGGGGEGELLTENEKVLLIGYIIMHRKSKNPSEEEIAAMVNHIVARVGENKRAAIDALVRDTITR